MPGGCTSHRHPAVTQMNGGARRKPMACAVLGNQGAKKVFAGIQMNKIFCFKVNTDVPAHAKSGGNSGDLHQKPPAAAGALSDFRRSVWLRPRAAAGVVQYCKNCLLVDVCCLFPPEFIYGFSFSSAGPSRKVASSFSRLRRRVMPMDAWFGE